MKYLTKREKAETLFFLREEYKQATLEPDGHLDLELIPCLERINACKGIATLQSCAGHKPSKQRNYTFDGHLWIRLSKEVNRLFENKLMGLIRHNLIRQVTRMYSYYEQKELYEIINIHFKGHEKGQFHKSMEFIAKFFEGLK